MASKKPRSLLALALPTVVGTIGGWIVGTTQYNRAVREIERTWHKPADLAIPDLTDVLFGYTALGVFVGTLIGLLVGIFLYSLMKNREPSQQTSVFDSSNPE